MGELMRRYWVPAILSWEIAEPDSPPVTIKLLGEELVAFRDTSGKVGVVGARCAHRRAHLFWGRNEENGLRCVYHGWKFDCEGRCIDMPSEPAESNFKDKVRIPAYPTFEVAGLVYCYMGPPEKKPAPPLFDWNQVPEDQRHLTKVWEECNWLQALEGGIDTVHSNFLHFGRPPGLRYDENSARGRSLNVSTAPIVEVVPTDYGYSYAGIRTMGAEGTNYIRAYHWVMPWNQIRASGETISGHMWVPMDDHNTMVFNWNYSFKGPLRPGGEYGGEGGRGARSEGSNESAPVERPQGAADSFYQRIADPEDRFRSRRNQDNKYLIDRQVQKTETFTGIVDINTQDRAVQESMGPIADRTLERLGTTDRAVITARRMLLNAVKSIQDGGDPPGVSPSYYKIRAHETVLPMDAYWYEALQEQLYQAPSRTA
jgi:phenylpropionate dioxygenase-like ring-hydroxylating dioxygenase large terminal subunit